MPNSAGEDLKNARLARGLSIEQTAIATHIRTHYLEALENEQPNALPSKIQARGFLRLYADFLDLPVDDILLRWNKDIAIESVAASMEQGQNTLSGPSASSDHDQKDSSTSPSTVSQPIIPGISQLSKSQTIFKEIGAILKTQRETLSLKLVDIEHFTHVPHHHLLALEKGDIDELPSPVQGKGMLSNYATFLELDVDLLLLRFADGLQERRLESLQASFQAPITTPRAVSQPSTFRRLVTPDLVIGSALILFLLAFTIWTAGQITSMRQENAQANKIPALSTLIMVTPTGTYLISSTETNFPSQIPRRIQANAEGSGNTGNNQAETEGKPTSIPALDNLPLQLYIIAHQRGLLQVTSDGKVVFLGRMVPGNAYPFSAREKLELLTGNAGAVEVIYNQVNYGILGQVGQVINYVFTKTGVFTPTPSFTETPTRTPIPSVTLRPTSTPVPPTITPYLPQKTR